VDALGNPVRLFLTPGNTLLADKAYGTLNIRTYIESQNATFCIPPKSNTTDPWACDFYQYKERHVVECFFKKLKQFRGIATRNDKLSRKG
jgi:transposase